MNESSKHADKDRSTGSSDPFTEMARLAAESQRAWFDSLTRLAGGRPAGDPSGDEGAAPEGSAAGASSSEDSETGAAAPAADPGELAKAHAELWAGYQKLFLENMRHMAGQEADSAIDPEPGDRRFRDAQWQDNPYFSFLKQSYLLNAAWLRRVAGAVEGLDEDTAQRLDFYNRQLVDALAPTNFALTNPTVLSEVAETRGESLAQGLDNLARDIREGGGRLAIRQTDPDAFEVGENIALTPGKVVFQNDLMQLIQYEPSTEQVYTRPLLIIPPWINKYYILDLRPQNSFVKWCVDQGYTVFLISWVNPDASYADKGFEDYMTEGPLAALDAIHEATGERRVNAIGYCIGGTLLAATQAWMAACEDDRIAAGIYFTAQVDFTEAGELRVFTDEASVSMVEQQARQQGYLDGSTMALAFNMMRANDLIWSSVINNYLLGKDAPAFDLLYWNSDSTRLPAAMWSFYIREMYQKNRLVEPGGITLRGVPIDLSRIETPVFFQATRQDHIAPFRSVYKAMNLFSGSRKFVLAGSGHIAGVINPPSRGKYPHWVNTRRKKYPDAEAWLADAEERPGSWWPALHTWLRPKSGKKVAARVPGDGGLQPIEDAPGSYVRVR